MILREGGLAGRLGPSQAARLGELVQEHPQMVAAYVAISSGNATADQIAAVNEFERRIAADRSRPWSGLVRHLSRQLVSLGVPPGGPRASRLTLGDSRTPWFRAFEPPTAGLWTPPLPDATERYRHQKQFDAYMATSVAEALIGTSRAARDAEDNLVAYVVPRVLSDSLDDLRTTALCSALRIFLSSGRWAPQDSGSASKAALLPPRDVVDYLRRAAEVVGVSPEELEADFEQALEPMLAGLVIDLAGGRRPSARRTRGPTSSGYAPRAVSDTSTRQRAHASAAAAPGRSSSARGSSSSKRTTTPGSRRSGRNASLSQS